MPMPDLWWTMLGPIAPLALLGRRRRRETTAARQAARSGHPCSTGLVLTPQQRRQVAADAADLLAMAGVPSARRRGGTTVTAMGADGEYLLDVRASLVRVSYRTNAGTHELGQYSSAWLAVRCIAGHLRPYASPDL